MQVFGDGEGHVVALADRECSVQRRHQKVIEECPSPSVNAAQRSALFTAATALCAAAKYRSAGTVEFLMDAATGAFYFLEVNTRLQVEHGITELVTGVDIVEWMLRLQLPVRSCSFRCLTQLTNLVVKPAARLALQPRFWCRQLSRCTGALLSNCQL